jgi:hypothetical protein
VLGNFVVTLLPKARPLLVLLLIAAVTAQAFAAVATSCPMAGSPTTAPMTAMQGMDHAGHAMHGMTDTDQIDSVCCDGGLCAMGHCLSSIALLHTPFSLNVAPSGDYTSSPARANPSPALKSLFRPPISR